MKQRLFIIAGEASGDVYGAYLIKLLKQKDSQLEIYGIGGDHMRRAGAILVHHIRELSVMGFVEVVKNISQLHRVFKSAQSHIIQANIDTVILIDFPGFNLKIAPWAKSKGIHTIQYISPKVWAWKESRISKIKKYIDTLICVFPFEVDYYRHHNIQAHYFGNPLYDIIDGQKQIKPLIQSEKPIIGLMPGSRKQEISRILPILLDFAEEMKAYTFIIGGMSLIGESFYKEIINEKQSLVSLMMDRNYDILHACDYVMNTSGTITLESLLFDKPQIVVYATHPISFAIISRLIKIKHISLPNILADNELVPELIQDNLTVKHLQNKLQLIQSKDFSQSYREIAQLLNPKHEENLVALLLQE